MNKRARLLAIIMVIVMCIGTIQPMYIKAEDETTTNLTTPEEGKILFETDLESNPFKAYGGSGTLVTDGTEHGSVLELNDSVSAVSRIEVSTDATPTVTFTSSASSIVYEFDLKIADLANTAFTYYVRKMVDGSGKNTYPCKVTAGGQLVSSGITLTSLSQDVWYKISVVMNYGTGYKDVYLDGVKISTDNTLPIDNNAYFTTVDGAYDAIRVAIELQGSSDSFKLDNFKIYEGTKPLDVKLTTPELGKILWQTDFSEESNPLRNVSGTISNLVTDDDKHGSVLEVKNGTRVDNENTMSSYASTMTASSIVYEFEMKIMDLENSAFTFNLVKYGTKPNGTEGNATEKLCSLSDLKTLKTLSAENWYKVSVVMNYAEGKKYVYLDGEKLSEATIVYNPPFTTTEGGIGAKRVEFALDSNESNCFRLDNFKIYEGTQPLTTPTDDGSDDGGTEDDDSDTSELRDPVEGTKIYEQGFDLTNPFYSAVVGASGTITRVEDDSEHGWVIEIQRVTTGELRSDPPAASLSTDSNSVVYEFDVKLLDPTNTIFHLLLRQTGNTSHGYVVTINSGDVLAYKGTAASKVATLNESTWYTVSVVQNYKTGYRDVYIDGVKVSVDNTWLLDDAFADGTTNLDRAKFETGGAADHFMLDNFRVYEGTVPYTGELLEPVEEEVVITIDSTKSVFETESLKNLWGSAYLDTLLEGYVALHTRSGQVYRDGEKVLLQTLPVETDNGYSVVLIEICEALGLTYTVEGTTAIVNSGSIQNQTVTVYESDGKLWVDAEEFLGIYGVVSIDTNEAIKSNGMMIAGATAFTWPSSEDTAGDELKTLGDRSMLENLNEYLFLEQPQSEEILALYQNSSVSGQHPRISVTASDVVRIKSAINTDELMNTWYQQLIAAADYLVNTNTVPLKYEFRDGVRLLYVSRDMLDHMYTLGMAYLLTGEQKYADRAYVDLEAVCDFPDWNPKHSLDTVEMTAAVAIGYDWMYNGLTEDQRSVVEKGLYKHAFVCAVSGYQEYGSSMKVNVLQDGNWNVIINSGFTLGALALMDVYPEVSSYIVSGAVRAVESMLIEFGPDGAWKEGPNYWEYTMQYATKMLSGLETVFGTCFSLDKIEGLSTAGNYIMHVQSDKGLFNYGDASAANYYVPELFYLADKYDNDELMTTLLDVSGGKMFNCSDVVLSLIWYNHETESENTAQLPIDGIYWTEGIATFRDKWSDSVTAFAGIHGGKTNVMHAQIDGGSFVYDYAGIRWAKDLGSTPYNTSVTSDRSEGSGRWLLYNSKAEAHNTLVINPEDGIPEQVVSSTARMIRFESDTKGGIAVLDLTENYAVNASSAIRGIFFTDDRTSFVVRDEITLKDEKANSTIYWFMQTDAVITVAEDGKSATLTQDGKTVSLEFAASDNVTATLIAGISTRELLGTTSPIAGTSEEALDVDHPGVNRVAIKLEGASGDVTITVKLTPSGVNSTPIVDYDKSISSWSIPEGEIAAKPEVQSVVIDGREIEFDDANQAVFLSVEGYYDSVPDLSVTVDETKFTYTVTEATTLDGGLATITVSDKTNPQVIAAYTIVFEQIPIAVTPDGYTGAALQVIGASVSAQPQASLGYVAWKVLDQDLDSRWTSQGIGNWILLELEEESTIDNMLIWFKNGNVRATYFTVSVSTDGVNYETVYSGESMGTALGDSEGYEQISLGGKTAKYVKIGCNGNSVQGVVAGWNNIGEVVFTGNVIAPIEIVAEKTDDTYTLGTNGTIEVYCNGLLNTFVDVLVDGNTVDESNYTLAKGSTLLTLKASYLETLTVGEHTVKMVYTAGRSDEYALTINAAETEVESSEASTEESSEEFGEQSSEAGTEESIEESGEESSEASTEESIDESGEESSEAARRNPVSSAESTDETRESDVSTGESIRLVFWLILAVVALAVTGAVYEVRRRSSK